MGLLDRVTGKSSKGQNKGQQQSGSQSVLEAAKQAQEKPDDSRINQFVSRILDVGLDGLGPLNSAQEVADAARKSTRNPEAAIDKVVRRHVVGGGVGGFATGIGGIITLPVAMPLNVVEFYVQATRMVGAIAILRGYDVRQPEIRTAVLLTLTGSHAEDVLKRAGVPSPTGKITDVALGNLPPAALMMVNKAIGLRLIKGLSEKAFARLGREIPLVGGAVGGGMDLWMMRKISQYAQAEFVVR